jgi:hypothetical protein
VKQRLCAMLQCINCGNSNRVLLRDSDSLDLTFEGDFAKGVSMTFNLCMRQGRSEEVSKL